MKWHKSRNGFISSHDGHFSIVPEYYGTTRAQSYAATFYPYPGKLAQSILVVNGCDTQAEAKAECKVFEGCLKEY